VQWMLLQDPLHVRIVIQIVMFGHEILLSSENSDGNLFIEKGNKSSHKAK